MAEPTEFTMKVVGKRRHAAPSSIEDTRQLLKTAWALRGTDKIARPGSIASRPSRRPTNG
ncbi:MAG: hypothetical protein HC897_13370 [Thermoanaerobaculia bacterium]|nr:hypothetical protein [Thermoanaerobaculia bacterium]